MTRQHTPRRCSDDDLAGLVEKLGAEGTSDPEGVDELLERYPQDERLLFMKGSLLAADRRYSEAILAMERAVHFEPSYRIARYQLGLLLLTEGNAAGASAVWEGLLTGRKNEDELDWYARGMLHIAAERIEAGAALLHEGLARTPVYPLVGRDIRKVLARIATDETMVVGADESLPHLLLNEYVTGNTTKH